VNASQPKELFSSRTVHYLAHPADMDAVTEIASDSFKRIVSIFECLLNALPSPGLRPKNRRFRED